MFKHCTPESSTASINAFLTAQDICNTVASMFKPGITQNQGRNMIVSEFKKRNCEIITHPPFHIPIVLFGSKTGKYLYDDNSVNKMPNLSLKEKDLF